MSLQRRRELARLTKVELIDSIIEGEEVTLVVESVEAAGVAAIQYERELIEAVESIGALVRRWGLSWEDDAFYLIRSALIRCQALPDSEITNSPEVGP